jgi:hypothetical protein
MHWGSSSSSTGHRRHSSSSSVSKPSLLLLLLLYLAAVKPLVLLCQGPVQHPSRDSSSSSSKTAQPMCSRSAGVS